MTVNTQHSSATSQSRWFSYYQWTNKRSEPRETLVKTVELFKSEGIEPTLAIDLGCGVGKETSYLVKKGWKVIAIDAEKVASQFLFEKIPEGEKDKVTFIVAKYENYNFPENVQIFNAASSLPYCHPDDFDHVMKKITTSISQGGRFCGNFFGPNDSWSSDPSKVFLEKDIVRNYFKDFKIDYFHETENDGISGLGPKHWHIHHIIAKKNINL